MSDDTQEFPSHLPEDDEPGHAHIEDYAERDRGQYSQHAAGVVLPATAPPSGPPRETMLLDAGRFPQHVSFAVNSQGDMLVGSDAHDQLNGANGDDELVGKAGDDDQFGGDGNDMLYGDGGRDWLFGGAGHDLLYGGLGNDQLAGDVGDDVLFGGAGDDRLIGGRGCDVLSGGAGNDFLKGGAGDDIYRFQPGDGADVIANDATTYVGGALASDHDRVEYGAGVTRDQLWWQRAGDDLKITGIESGDSQTIKNWYRDTAHRIGEFVLSDGMRVQAADVEPLVAAMATMSMPGIGNAHLPAQYQAVLNPVLAESWQ